MTPDELDAEYARERERTRDRRLRQAARATECGHYLPRTDMLGDSCNCLCPLCYDPVGDECVCVWCSHPEHQESL